MTLNKQDYELLRQLDELLMSENESVRELIQQAMVMQALSRDTEDKSRDVVLGPFTKLMHSISDFQNRIDGLETQLSQIRNQNNYNNATTGGYWNNGTVTVPTTGTTIWQTGLGPTLSYGDSTTSLDKEYLTKLQQWVRQAPSKTVTATTAADPDAMTLIDPDTGHTMHVK